MSHERWHVIEKIQIQVAAAGALAFMYFAGWQAFRPTDATGALVFLPTGTLGPLLVFAGVVWLLAAAVAVLTISARLEGAVLALLIGVAGGSMRTAPMRLLVNRFEDGLPGLMGPLAAEVLCLAAILLIATTIIALVRRGLHRLLPDWMVPAGLRTAGVAAPEPGAEMPKASWLRRCLILAFGPGVGLSRTKTERRPARRKRKRTDEPAGADAAYVMVASFGLTLLAGLLLMMVTLRETGSTDRGQIIFSLAISFFLSAWAVSSFFPAGFSAPYWAAPLVLAIAIYVKSCWFAPLPPLTFAKIGAFANILPVDWLGAGCGGAVGGYWLSCRLREAKHVDEAAPA